MKLITRFIWLCLVSPYLIFSCFVYQVHAGYSPIVSQEILVTIIEKPSILGSPLEVWDTLDTCDGAWRDFKSYMNWGAITNHDSQQYKFISDYMDTTSEDGLLYLKSDTRFIGVALGSYFGKIGSKFKITLEGGIILYLVKVEEKADKHVNNGCVHKQDSSIIEFVINDYFKDYYPSAADRGSLHVLPQFQGMITKIEIIEYIEG